MSSVLYCWRRFPPDIYVADDGGQTGDALAYFGSSWLGMWAETPTVLTENFVVAYARQC
jgi:hypothetical protein